MNGHREHHKTTPHLWFDKEAKEAAQLYRSSLCQFRHQAFWLRLYLLKSSLRRKLQQQHFPSHRFEPGRFMAIPPGIEDRNTGQLLSGLETPEHKATAAHIAASNECSGKHQLFTKEEEGPPYFGVAMLPRRTTSQLRPIVWQRAWASRSSGIRCRASPGSTVAAEISRNRFGSS